jgi:hypothetical protein
MAAEQHVQAPFLTATRAPLGGRLVATRIVGALQAVSAIAFGLITLILAVVDPAQEIHAFHNAMVAALLLVLSAPASIAIAVDPRRAVRPLVVLTVVGIAALATMALSLTIDPFTLPFVLILALQWALLPDRRGALPAGRPSTILLALVLVAAAPLMVYALAQAELQRVDHASEHAAFYHWVEASFAAVAVVLLGLLAAIRPAAYRLAGRSAGAGLAVLGAASIALGGFASAFDAPWGWAALTGGIVYVAVAEWQARRDLSPNE